MKKKLQINFHRYKNDGYSFFISKLNHPPYFLMKYIFKKKKHNEYEFKKKINKSLPIYTQ